MLKIVLDTNTLIRFFTNDMPDKAQQVRELLESDNKLVIPEVVFFELEYILKGTYLVQKDKIIEIFMFLLGQKNIKVEPKVRQAVEIFKESKLDMADCIIAAASFKGELASFDQELLRIKKIKPYWE